MPCTRPIRGFRQHDGTVRFDAQAEREAHLPVNVACGQCIGCRLNRSSEWTTRILHEAQMHTERKLGSSFVTLTYDDDHLPTDYGLQITHWQLFAKRLRKKLGSFRFFACGEYGPLTQRPHYHAILFGIDFAHDRIPITVDPTQHRQYFSPTLQQLWGMGDTRLSGVALASAAYVAKYSIKKRRADDATYTRRKDGYEWQVRPEYANMSLRDGIGKEWFLKYHRDVYPSDETIVNGKRVRTPRYYDKLLETQDANALTKIKNKRKEHASSKRQDSTEARLQDFEELAKRREKDSKHTL